jgi:hypothetical protein
VPSLRLDLGLGDHLVINVQFQRTIRLVVLTLSLLYEINTNDVFDLGQALDQ